MIGQLRYGNCVNLIKLSMNKVLITLFFLLPLLAYSQNDTIIFVSEVTPSFPGGDDTLKTFISNNFIYPKGEKIKGTCYLQFTVTKQGIIKDIVVVKSLSSEIDQECVRVIEIMPNWLPGTIGGKVSDVIMSMPIKISTE